MSRYIVLIAVIVISTCLVADAKYNGTTSKNQTTRANGISITDDSEDNGCFQNKSVTAMMALMIIAVVGVAALDTVLGYQFYKLRKQLMGGSHMALTTSGVAPVSTMIKK
ncbi:uncharacterized protein [Mytilus edulis]|uniref:uncharacterized protein n=1 Tax=Mytilus edulis TaxID=6550 RepID=UPI0039EE180D